MISSGVRPFGVSLLICGYDYDEDRPFLYQCDPSVSFSYQLNSNILAFCRVPIFHGKQPPLAVILSMERHFWKNGIILFHCINCIGL
jgi:hypothetical protein